MWRSLNTVSPSLHRPFFLAPNFFPSPEKSFELLVYAEPLTVAFPTQHIADSVSRTKYLDPQVMSWWMMRHVNLINLPFILWQYLLVLLILRMARHRQCYASCLVIILCIALSILLLEYIIHYSIGVQIPLCNLFGLQFEDIYFKNFRSSLLTWSQITSECF
jgi:hypothetical protein